jgi:hypothetical protein
MTAFRLKIGNDACTRIQQWWRLKGKRVKKPSVLQVNEPVQKTLNITVQPMHSDDDLVFQVKQFDTIKSLKMQIHDVKGVRVDDISLVFDKKKMQDNLNFRDYDITEDTSIFLVVRLCGGAKGASKVIKQHLKEKPESNRLSKDDQIANLQHELDMTLTLIKSSKDGINQKLDQEIEKFNEGFKKHTSSDVMTKVMGTLSKPQLKKLMLEANSNNKYEQQMLNLARATFEECFSTMTSIRSSLGLYEQAIRLSTSIAFNKTYIGQNGTISWESYKNDLLDLVSEQEPKKKEGCFQS